MNTDFTGRTIFIDRDGTLIVEKHYLADPDQVELCGDAIEGLRLFHQAGFQLVVLTNQSGIGRGYFSEPQMCLVHQRIRALLASEGISVAAILHCPHTPADHCLCRKPNSGLVEMFSHDCPMDAGKSWMIGDRWCDVEMARNARLKSVWIENFRHPEEIDRCRRYATFVAGTIHKAARLIIG